MPRCPVLTVILLRNNLCPAVDAFRCSMLAEPDTISAQPQIYLYDTNECTEELAIQTELCVMSDTCMFQAEAKSHSLHSEGFTCVCIIIHIESLSEH